MVPAVTGSGVKTDQEIYGESLLSLAYRLRKTDPTLKLSEVQDLLNKINKHNGSSNS